MKTKNFNLTCRMVVLCIIALTFIFSNNLQAQVTESSGQDLVLHKDNTGKLGFADKQGKVVISCKYETAFEFDGNLAFVRLDKKWGMIDKTGKTVVPHKYDMLGLAIRNGGLQVFCDGFARVQLNGKWGYLDKTGSEVISCIYDEAGDFSNGIATVKLNDESFKIDKSGKRVD